MHMGLGRLAATGGVVALGVVMAAAGFAPSAAALEGQDAKGLGKDVDWINGPPIDQFEKLRGRVILVDLWGIN